MKRFFAFVFVLVAGLTVAVAQHNNHFTVDLNFNKSIKGDDGYAEKELDFWGISATGGYRFYLIKGLYITPEVTLYYEKHKNQHVSEWTNIDGGHNEIINSDERDWTSEAGLGLGGMMGYNLKCDNLRRIDIFTGPYFDCSFVQKDESINRPSFKWRFGAAFSISRIYIKGSFDLALTNLMDNLGEANSYSVGIGYHF